MSLRRRMLMLGYDEEDSKAWETHVKYDIEWIVGEKITKSGIKKAEGYSRTKFLPCEGAKYVYFQGMETHSACGLFDKEKNMIRYIMGTGNTYVEIQEGECWITISNTSDSIYNITGYPSFT